MAPFPCRSWMSTHRNIYGDLPVSDLCLPESYDAGTCRLLFGTKMATESNVLSQTRSIFDQLELGVRLFDIRPILAAPDGSQNLTWNCGNYTGEAYDKNGWQGGSCAAIQEVVDDVNRFTKDNSELVILKISHSLFKLLSGINALFTLQRAGGNKDKPIQDYQLNDFIRDNRAAVVVVVYGNNSDELYQYGLWPSQTTTKQATFEVNGTSVTRSFSPLSQNGDSILSLAGAEQAKEFPFFLQRLAAGDLPRSIGLHRIEDPDLLSFSLAVTYQRYNNQKGLKDKIIVYGGHLISDPDVHRKVQEAIDNGQSFPVSNEALGGDPWLLMVKSCAVFYRQDGLLKGRWAKEGNPLHFGLDILSVKYGWKQINDQSIYLRLFRCIALRGSLFVSDENFDPQPGSQDEPSKLLIVDWRDVDGNIEQACGEEQHHINFATMEEQIRQIREAGWAAIRSRYPQR